MIQAERRIRRLKIRGRDDDMPRMRSLLEEAFRIASLPGLPPNATVLVRRLDLGRIHTNLSPGRLADIVSETVHNQARGAVCLDQQSFTGEAGVVWFSDPLRPYQVLLQRLLDGKAANEWYWASFFPNQQLSLNQVLISALMAKACQTQAGGLSIALLVQACLQPARLSRLFPLLTPTLVRQLLHMQGIAPEALPDSLAQRPERRDNLVFGAKTHRLIPPPNLNGAWRDAIKTAGACWGYDEVRTRWLALQALFCFRPIHIERRDVLSGIAVSHWLEAWSTSMSDEHRGQGNGPESKTQGYGADEVWSASQERAFSPLGAEAFQERGAAPAPQDHFVNTRSAAQIRLPHVVSNADSINGVSNIKPGQFSAVTGFALLIPLLQRLWMDELLWRHAVLQNLDFPRQLLWAMATRFKVNEQDPVWRLFEGLELTPNAIIENFSPPPAWQQLMQASNISPRHFPMQAKNPRFQQLIAGLQLGCAMFLRHHCKLSLPALIRRPGNVVLTETHWDAVFDLNQTDLRLRRMALDSDPGWVSWLAKVVQFHYISGG